MWRLTNKIQLPLDQQQIAEDKSVQGKPSGRISYQAQPQRHKSTQRRPSPNRQGNFSSDSSAEVANCAPNFKQNKSGNDDASEKNNYYRASDRAQVPRKIIYRNEAKQLSRSFVGNSNSQEQLQSTRSHRKQGSFIVQGSPQISRNRIASDNSSDLQGTALGEVTFVIDKTELISLKKNASQGQAVVGGIDHHLEASTVARQFIEAGFNTRLSTMYNAMEEKQEFTIYFVEVRTMLSQWVVGFRYSQLHQFNKELRERYNKRSNLPSFPKKCWFNKNQDKVVQQRRLELTVFLNEMARVVNILRDDVICRFFDFHASTQQLLIDMHKRGIISDQGNPQPSVSSAPVASTSVEGQNGVIQTPQSQQILHKIIADSCEGSQSSHSYMKLQQKYGLRSEELVAFFFYQLEEMLLFGFTDHQLLQHSKNTEPINLSLAQQVAGGIPIVSNPQGLLILAKNYQHHLLSAITSVQLLAKMLDYQKNLHAEAVLKELTSVPPKFLAYFNLEKLFRFEGSKKPVLQIFKAYIERWQHVQPAQETLKQLVSAPEDQKLVCEFLELNHTHNKSMLIDLGQLKLNKSHEAQGVSPKNNHVNNNRANNTSLNATITSNSNGLNQNAQCNNNRQKSENTRVDSESTNRSKNNLDDKQKAALGLSANAFFDTTKRGRLSQFSQMSQNISEQNTRTPTNSNDKIQHPRAEDEI